MPGLKRFSTGNRGDRSNATNSGTLERKGKGAGGEKRGMRRGGMDG